MVVILIHWLIKHGFEDKFIETWKHEMKIPQNEGLYREILTSTDSENEDPRFQTFSIESPHYRTYINIGIWRSIEDFDRLISSKYIPHSRVMDNKNFIELKDFEFKLRERIVLKVISDRGGELPTPQLAE